MKKKKCVVCQKRYVSQQEWKTAREKEICFTCGVVDKAIESVLIALVRIAKEKGLDFHCSAELKPSKKIKEEIR